MNENVLIFDIGASSGRAMMFSDGGSSSFEMHRFKNEALQRSGHLYWDVDALFSEMKEALKKCLRIRKLPHRIGITTFGVDYVLLDREGKMIDGAISYRDKRTEGGPFPLNPKEQFMLTGVYPHSFNTSIQLYVDKDRLVSAERILFFPSYLAYLLTGNGLNEFSFASTSALMNAKEWTFAKKMLDSIGISPSMFGEISLSGKKIGHLKEEIASEIGYSSDVYLALTHDTASSFKGAEGKKGQILLSSGTWSLLGTVLEEAIITEEAYGYGFSNEMSSPKEIRFLKNIIGMYPINRLMVEFHKKNDIVEVVNMAKASHYDEIVNLGRDAFLNPKRMKKALDQELVAIGSPLPKSDADYYRLVYRSLAKSYAYYAHCLSRVTKQDYKILRIFGGGSKNAFLNELTEKETGLKVIPSGSEATSCGAYKSITEE